MKEVKYTKTLAKIQVGVSFHMRDTLEKFSVNFKSVVRRGHVGALLSEGHQHGGWKQAETFRLPSSVVKKA